MLRLAQAASSEFGTEYGTPPNQRRTPGKMDGELNIVPFYGRWDFVFRPKSNSVAERIAYLMEGAVANPNHIGYGQDSLKSDGGKYKRTGVFDALFQMSNPDTFKINTLCNCDCSSLVGACVYGAGKADSALYNPSFRTMWTGNEREMLRNTCCFIELTDPLLLEIGTGLKRGDILLWFNPVTEKGHTAVALDTDDHLVITPYKITDCKACNIRKGPGTEYAVIHSIEAGEIVDVIATADNGWKRILLPDGFGYVSGKYAKKPLPTMTATGDVWLRKNAGKANAGIIVIPQKASVYVTGAKKKVSGTQWYEVIYGGHRGWSSGKLLK